MQLDIPAVHIRQRVEDHRLDLITRTVENGLQFPHRVALVHRLDLELGCVTFRPRESAVTAEHPDKKIFQLTTPDLHTGGQDHSNRVVARRMARPGFRAGEHRDSKRQVNDARHSWTYDNLTTYAADLDKE